MERTPEQRLDDELARIGRSFAPGRPCQREEIEHAYDNLQTELHDAYKHDVALVLAGYERREIDARTHTNTASFEPTSGQSVAQQLEAKQFIAAMRADIARALNNDKKYQDYKEILKHEMADNYEAMLNQHHEHRSRLMAVRGFEMTPEVRQPPQEAQLAAAPDDRPPPAAGDRLHRLRAARAGRDAMQLPAEREAPGFER